MRVVGGAGRCQRATVLPAVLAGPFAAVAALGVLADVHCGQVAGDGRFWLLTRDEASWAVVDPAAGTALDDGPRRLWREVEDAYTQWSFFGSPAYDRLGLRATAAGTRLCLEVDDCPVVGL